jgi:alpha-beta hydrolase superfamily lysophospholipase
MRGARWRRIAVIAVGASLVHTGAAAAQCTTTSVDVPGAERQVAACLDDLTTAGTVAGGHTNPADYSGLQAAGTRNPTGVPGVQIDGYFPDDSTTNTNNGWAHDSQFVIRLPEHFNGRLVITASPGNRRQYANDFIISDWVLAAGYAFAATDKGNTGAKFYNDGKQPGDAIAEWHRRVTQLTVAAKLVVARHYRRLPARTYITGISNGGYVTRYALETHPELYDGGVDWEGSMFRPEGPNLLTFLPPALAQFPSYQANGDQAAHDAIIAAGFAAGSEFLWPYHFENYWGLTQDMYRRELDPSYDGAANAYDYAARPAAVKQAVARISDTGRIGRPMITLHGTLDALLPIREDSDVYRGLVERAGRAPLHRYYAIENGNHFDSLHDRFPDRVRPMLPCYRAAFEALTGWVEHGQSPDGPHLVAAPTGGDAVNRCTVAGVTYPR